MKKLIAVSQNSSIQEMVSFFLQIAANRELFDYSVLGQERILPSQRKRAVIKVTNEYLIHCTQSQRKGYKLLKLDQVRLAMRTSEYGQVNVQDSIDAYDHAKIIRHRLLFSPSYKKKFEKRLAYLLEDPPA